MAKPREAMAKRAAANTPNAAPVKGFKHLTVAQVEAGLRKANGYITIAARLIGCDPSTIRRPKSVWNSLAMGRGRDSAANSPAAEKAYGLPWTRASQATATESRFQ